MKKIFSLFAAVLFIGSMMAETVDFSAQGYSNGQAIESYAGENFSITFSKGSNNNAPKYYAVGTAIRCYGGNTFTVTSTNDITKIEFTFSSGESSNAITADQGTYADNVWTGSANSVTFTIGGTSGHRRLQVLDVTVSAGGDTPTPGEDPVHASYAIEGSYPTEFTVGDVFSHDGAVIYDVMSDNSKSDITAQCVFVAPDMTTAGNKTVSVELLGAEILTYNITVSDAGTPQPSAATAVDIVGVSGNYDAAVNGETAVKLGSSKAGGSFSITVPANATKLSFYCAAWKGVNDLSLVVTPTGVASPESIALTPDDGISNSSPFTLSGNASSFLHEITLNLTSETTLTFTAAKRCVAWGASYEVAAGTIAAPVIDCKEYVKGPDSVKITCATADVAIYYSIDGVDPVVGAANTELYTEPFVLTGSFVIKAIAVKEGESSAVASKTMTFISTLTCGSANTLNANERCYLSAVQVVYINGANIYVQDHTGSTLIYSTSDLGVAVGDSIIGFGGIMSPYHNLPELKPFVRADELTIIHGEQPEVQKIYDVPNLAMVNIYAKFMNVSVEGEFTAAKSNLDATMGEKLFVLRNNFQVPFTFEAGKEYDIVGCVAVYDTIVQLYFVSAEESVEPIGPTPAPQSNMWKVSAETSVEAESEHVNNDLLAVVTPYASTLGAVNITIDDTAFTNYIQVRTDGYPSDQMLVGKEKAGSTSLTIVAKKNIALAIYYRRQALNSEYADNDNKDLKVFDRAAISTALPAQEFIISSYHNDDPASGYAYVVKGVVLEAGHIYTVAASGTTIQLYGLAFAEQGSTPTALDKAEVEQQVRKVIENGQLLILRDGKAYGVDGRLVR